MLFARADFGTCTFSARYQTMAQTIQNRMASLPLPKHIPARLASLCCRKILEVLHVVVSESVRVFIARSNEYLQLSMLEI